ncbi:FecCD family ABC transporter permease [Actibacterium lipolyticum]|uniref:Putative siderophore transport system permease protein YfhA n=1 Tax=Actibacterium lipolyticum TaxID=1524263 RepID=A0A238L8R6_9RHOB|nr:iron ABC transporter permease [Actibacterium lipolyticum]SMX51220.1 putative siderophore transport system permease protein YfhA [Actibacterium lipolyticum]
MKGGVIIAVLLVLAVLFGLLMGQVQISPAMMWQGLVTGEGPGALMLGVIRGPRVFTAVGAGAVLGLSGAIFQTLFRNPLAAPDIMGFTAGAGLAVVMAIAFGVSAPMPIVAAVGGLLAGGLVAALAYQRQHVTPPLTLILIGLGVGFAASALSTFLMTRLTYSEAAEAQRWLTGSLAARDWTHVSQVWGIGLVLTLFALGQSRFLSAMELGADLAAGLGVRVERARWGLSVTAVLLAATGVAVAGPVPFVALMAGPFGIRLTGATTLAGRLMSAAAAGALIIVAADLCARAAISGVQLPVGVMTGILGAPYLLWRLSREMERGEL